MEYYAMIEHIEGIIMNTNKTPYEQACTVMHSVDKYIRQLNDTGKPPLGLIPKQLHEERVKAERFNEVRSAITRRCDAGLKIDKEWIKEYNELAELVNEREKIHVASHSRASFYKQF